MPKLLIPQNPTDLTPPKPLLQMEENWPLLAVSKVSATQVGFEAKLHCDNNGVVNAQSLAVFIVILL